jgi:uncharacterized membrane protein
MKNKDQIVKATLLSLIALATSGALITHSFAHEMTEQEKCYGIAKKGMNDCQTSKSDCAGSSTKDSQKDAFILLPKGTCIKIVNASLTPQK